jgi:hypothetical protein
MRDVRELVFHVSDVRVEVRCELPDVRRGLGAVWRSCAHPLLPERCSARFAARREGERFVIESESEQRSTDREQDVLPLLEAMIYAAIPGWHARWVLLHAACLGVDGSPLLIVAPSGGGKSSMALAALRAGCEYFGDELAVTDGARVWGVPRALQFSACVAPAGLPPWGGDADVESYRLRVEGERMGCVPLFAPPAAQLPAAPFPVEALRVVAVERAERSAIAPLSSLQALAHLHEACFEPPRIDLGGLVREGRTVRLHWDTPTQGLAMLRAWIAQR